METNEENIDDIMTMVGINADAIMTLQTDVMNNEMAIGDVEGEVDDL